MHIEISLNVAYGRHTALIRRLSSGVMKGCDGAGTGAGALYIYLSIRCFSASGFSVY